MKVRPRCCCWRRQLEAGSGDQPLFAAAGPVTAAAAARPGSQILLLLVVRWRRQNPNHDHLRRSRRAILRRRLQQLDLLAATDRDLAAPRGCEVLHHPRAIITALKEKENVSVINVMYVSLEIYVVLFPKKVWH